MLRKRLFFAGNIMDMEFKHIVSNPAILGGKPVIRGSRISVQLVLEWVASGATIQQIVQKFPHLTEEGVREAVLYAAKAVANEVFLEVEIALAA
jgi:uncharacterized protein (DUF433 family)